MSEKLDFLSCGDQPYRTPVFQCCKNVKDENGREVDTETFPQETLTFPVVPLWGTALFQGYQCVNMHFPPSPEAALPRACLTFVHC